MKTNVSRKLMVVFLIGFFVISNVLSVSTPVYADPLEGRGSDRAHEMAHQGHQGVLSSQVASPATDVVQEVASQGSVASIELSAAGSSSSGTEASQSAGDLGSEVSGQVELGGNQAPDLIQEMFQHGSDQALDLANLELSSLEVGVSESALEHARWDFNAVDDRPQGNHGNVEMLDPYGFARDNRLELDGDRGRPFRLTESTEIVPCAVEYEPIYSSMEEAIAILSETYPELSGDTLMVTEPTTVETLLTTSPTTYDLSSLINYAEAYRFVYYPGDTVEYDLSLTNPYDEPLTLSVTATIEYMNVVWTYNSDLGTYQRENLVGDPVQGESTETWETITLHPGETLVLYDSYYMPTTAYWSNYQIDVTLTDLSSGATYNDPAAGWFDPPLDVDSVHRQDGSHGHSGSVESLAVI